MATKPTGIRNNNYLNVKNTADPWRDADGRSSKTDSRGHAVFTDAAWGVRAGILQLKSCFHRHNRRTVAEILSRWAPASDTIGSIPGAPSTSPVEYTNFVTRRIGIGPNEVLGIFGSDKSIGNVGQLRDLFLAMAAYEIGGGFKVPSRVFRAGRGPRRIAGRSRRTGILFPVRQVAGEERKFPRSGTIPNAILIIKGEPK